MPSNETAQQNPNTGQNCTTKSQHWAKLHNEITTLDKTAQPNHNTGLNCTTKSQHCTKLHNQITTLYKTAQPNHNTVQNCTTKSQHWVKLHNEITTLDKTAQPNHNAGQNFTTKSQHWTKLYNQITTLGKTAQRNHSEVQVLRSSRPEAFCKKCVLRDFAKFKGKRLCQILLFNKVVGLRSANLLKKSLWHRCFPVNSAKFLRTTFFTEHIRWLLLSAAQKNSLKIHSFLFWFC